MDINLLKVLTVSASTHSDCLWLQAIDPVQLLLYSQSNGNVRAVKLANIPHLQSLLENKVSWHCGWLMYAAHKLSVMKDQYVILLLAHGLTYAQADESRAFGMVV